MHVWTGARLLLLQRQQQQKKMRSLAPAARLQVLVLQRSFPGHHRAQARHSAWLQRSRQAQTRPCIVVAGYQVVESFGHSAGDNDDDNDNDNDGDRAPVRLVFYTSKNCPLCDGLKDKLVAVMQEDGGELQGLTLEIRDVEDYPRLRNSVPLVGAITAAGVEVFAPRWTPRILPAQLANKVRSFLSTLPC